MQVEFIKENALLIGLAVGSGITLLWPLLSRGAAGVPNISPTEAVMMMSRSKPLILDVRDAAEFEAGHIQGAKHIPLAELAGRMKELEKFKEKPVVVHCQTGVRAKSACTLLRAQQFTQLHHLQGGLAAWQEAKMPIVKSA
ncbi:MAG: sulfurtransferase [Methylophilales bacterium 16-45-7]|nr:MAG: sulfurtransferase [Methylophilales bacterium 16-45-7]